ncbi:hypothetical protein RIF29_33558 [Crotalaria pallida]|uniref:Uncharacterized protein n=1 Tax=Crotalaria pallida TaxID=3830 RepID=A0AAN9HWV9_CROPI
MEVYGKSLVAAPANVIYLSSILGHDGPVPVHKCDWESADGCGFKRRRDAQFHPSPFERSFSAVSPICSQVGDGMDMS